MTGCSGFGSPSSSKTVCTTAAIIGTCGYALAKMFMYLVFIARLKVIWNNSLFAYNYKAINVMAVCIIIYSVSLSIATASSTTGDIVVIEEGKYQCETHVVFGIIECQVFLDLIANCLCCYLFVKPLKHMLQLEGKINPQQKEHSVEQDATYKCLRKSIILTFVAVTSTAIVLIFMAASGFTAFVAIDVVINCICIMMFNKHYAKYYHILCCGAMRIAHKCCGNFLTK